MNLSDLPQRILNHVLYPGYRPSKPTRIADDLGLPDEDYPQFKRVLKQLIKQGSLKFGAQHLVLPPSRTAAPADSPKPSPRRSDRTRPSDPESESLQTRKTRRPRLNDDRAGQASRQTKVSDSTRTAGKGERTGIFRKASGGYGFVTPQSEQPRETEQPRGGEAALPAEPRDRRADDIFIPEHKTLDAADGDLVRIRMAPGRDRTGRTSGVIVEVLQRKTHRFVGTYRERGGKGFVTVDAAVFDTDVLVGDAGAKNVRAGDKVVVEMVHFPGPKRSGEAVIVDVLGPRGQPGVDTQTIIHQFGLPGEFSEEVIADARRSAERFDEANLAERTDFTGETVITIDPAEARDFDDAISLRRIENDHWLLGVHIADVSHFVVEDSPLDIEARNRGTSVYLPDRVIPMLPEIISNNLASLQPDRVRYTMSVEIEFDPQGHFVASTFHRGAIRSAHRFNYEEIDEYLADDRPWRSRLKPDVFRLVREMHTLAMLLRKKRVSGGSIELTVPDVQILLDEDGKVRGAEIEKNTESHQMIEEFMLAANEAVARRLAVDESLNLMRRIHEAPSPLKLKQLTDFISALGIKTRGLESRFEIKRLIEQSIDRPESTAINVAVLRSMQKAIYSPRDIGHYALNSDYYCHFTSPIRRYPDLVIHRMIGDLIDGKRPRDDFGQLERLGQHCSELEQRAEKAERDLIRLKLLNYLADKLGTTFDAVVTGVEANGIYCLCHPLPVDGFIPVDMLPRDRYFFDRGARSLTGHRTGNAYRIGDRLRVRVALVDPDKRDLELELVKRLESPHRDVAPKSTAKSNAAKSNTGKSNTGKKSREGQGTRPGDKPPRRAAKVHPQPSSRRNPSGAKPSRPKSSSRRKRR